MKRIVFNILLLLFFTHQFCFGEDFRYLRTNEGLYNGEINSIAQDHSGKMWFGTWSGLTSYNGYDFQFFMPQLANPLSLPNKKINKIFIDSSDNLWVATLSGIAVFRKDDQTFHSIQLDGLLNVDVYVFGFIETKNNVLIQTNFGIYLTLKSDSADGFGFRTKKLKLYSGNNEASDFVHYMKSFNDKLVIVSNSDPYSPTRLIISDLVINEKDTLLQIQNRVETKLEINSVTYYKEENKLFLGTTDGLTSFSLFELSFSKIQYFKGINIQNVLLASNNKLYCYSTNPALMYVDLQTLRTGANLPDPVKFGSLLDNNIMCIFEDFSGNLWIGHQGLGLSILNLNRKAFNSYKRDPSNPRSLTENIVMCFNGNGKDVFIGLRQGGLNVTSKQNHKSEFVDFKQLGYRNDKNSTSAFNIIWDIARESDSLFWVASNGGVAKLQKRGSEWQYGSISEKPLYDEGTVRKIFVDKEKNLWIGTSNYGLYFFPAIRNNPSRRSFHFPNNPNDEESLSNKTVLSMFVDSKDRFWVGTNNGLNLLKSPYSKLDFSGNATPEIKFTRFIATRPEKYFLNANEINSIYENEDGKIWIATQGGGINILNADSMKFTHFTVDNGLSGNDVLGILADKTGSKWISTNKGIETINFSNKSKPYTYYSNSDGLQGETFKVNSYYQSKDGEMFFGGDNGFTRFYPEQIRQNPIAPKIGLTNFRISGKLLNVGDTIGKGIIMNTVLDDMSLIKLPFDKNSFSIGVGVHHYQYPEGNRIMYKLDGFNDHWITVPASNQNIYFSKLPYGNYLLHISALSADNVMAESERTLEIQIFPPWYKTWYFQTFIMILIFSFLGIIIFWFANRQQVSFQKKIDEISIENNENKMRFLTNIAHELRTPLSLVIAPIEDLKQNYTDIDPKWKNHLSLIYRNSNYLLTLINQIIDFRKLNAGKLQLNLQTSDVVALVKEVVANFKGLESRRKSFLKFNLPEESIFVDIDSQKIEEVLYNLLSNAFKHTKEDNVIEVSLQVIAANETMNKTGKDLVRISVFNEGKDISDDDKEKIFERFYKVSEQIDGAGIGLSFSKSLIELHGGLITVESIENKGVTFHVDIPYSRIERTSLDNNENTKGNLWYEDVFDYKEVQELENNGKDLSIVIVEDNVDLRNFLSSTLSGTYECYEAGNGKEGLEIINRILPDIIISDVIMPKMDGYEMCEKVKGNSKTCHIPIILLTANNASEHIISGYQKGADAYVTKPFDMNIIRTQISRLITNRELIREKYMTQNFMVEVSTSNMSKDDEFIVRLRQLLEDNLSETDFNVKKLSSDLNISTTHLYRKLKALTGLSPVEFIRTFKLQKACELLSTTNLSIKEIGYGLGFNNLSYFVKCFREQFGLTPSTYRKTGLQELEKNDSTNQSEVV